MIVVTIESVKDLNLDIGSNVTVVVKSTSVMLLVGDAKISARNKLDGKVNEIEKGAVNAKVTIDING